MPNIFDYLHWRADVPLSASPFNEEDDLILAELIYTDFAEVVPDDGSAISLQEARDRFFTLHSREEIEARTAHSYTARVLLVCLRISMICVERLQKEPVSWPIGTAA